MYFPVPAHNWRADVGGRVIKASWDRWVGVDGDAKIPEIHEYDVEN